MKGKGDNKMLEVLAYVVGAVSVVVALGCLVGHIGVAISIFLGRY
jgi:hypothetical protein